MLRVIMNKYLYLFAIRRANTRWLLIVSLSLALPAFSNNVLATSVAGEQGESSSNECVVALHGLARSAASMKKLAEKLEQTGYTVANIDYPSRKYSLPELAESAVARGLESCERQGAGIVHFVSHSMGGILIRQYLQNTPIENLGRVVMLAPPNQGSEVVDALRDTPGFELLNGPAGLKLGTDAASIPRSLGPATFDLGVVAGTRSINLLLSTYLPDPDDGKVSVASAQLQGMCDFITVAVSHPFIMRDEAVILQVIHYLSKGRFSKESDTEINQWQGDELPSHCTPAR